MYKILVNIGGVSIMVGLLIHNEKVSLQNVPPTGKRSIANKAT